MKRPLVFFSAFALCVGLAGCRSDTHDGLVSDTILMIGRAASEVGNIKARVTEAVDRTKKEDKKLDLEEAIKATKQLKEVGDAAQELRRRIEKVRADISPEDRKINAAKHKGALNTAFSDLLKQKTELRAALADAEALGPSAKAAVKDLREKIQEAESPFEALSR